MYNQLLFNLEKLRSTPSEIIEAFISRYVIKIETILSIFFFIIIIIV